MQDEYQSLIDNKTWELCDPPKNKTIVKNQWLFRVKKDSEGEIERHKARLVAKGYTQIEGIDYSETYAPVVRNSTVRFVTALAVEKDLKIDHLDVTTAFLNGELTEEVYIYQPEGLVKFIIV